MLDFLSSILTRIRFWKIKMVQRCGQLYFLCYFTSKYWKKVLKLSFVTHSGYYFLPKNEWRRIVIMEAINQSTNEDLGNLMLL